MNVAFRCFALAACAVMSVAPAAGQSSYPARPIEIINQYPPGGIADNSFRAIQPYLSKELNTTLVAVTKAGAGGAIATEYVRQAKGDGYTILNSANPPLTLARAANPNIRYRLSDFTVIGRYSLDPTVLVVKKGSPWRSFDDVVAFAKANPGKLTYGDGGMGGAGHFTVEMVKQLAGVTMEGVHFQGSGPLRTALLGGHIDVASGNLSTFLGDSRSGELIALITTAARRHATLPEVPTMTEKNIADAAFSSYMFLVVPAETPAPIVSTLARALAAVMQNQDALQALQRVGMVPDYIDGPTATKILEAEYERVASIAGKVMAGKK